MALDAEGQPARVAGMCTDITERRRAEESLRALVGGVVHEIRNPVYGISINLDALEATFGEEPRYGPFVAALRESAERIASLMNDLRDYGEPRTLNPEPSLVRALLEEAVRSCETLARRQVVRRPRSTWRTPRWCCRSTRRRDAPGLPEPPRERPPPRPARARRSVSRAAGPLARGHRLVDLHRGGRGPGFDAETLVAGLRALLHPAEGRDRPRALHRQAGGGGARRGRRGGEPPGAAARCVKVRLPAPRTRRELMGDAVPKPKILLIEDDPAVRHGMAAFLRANELDVDEAETCQQALERFRAVGHDVVVADYSLPDGTSLDILPQVKKLSEDTPFIILTAHGSIDLAVRAIKEGAEQFLTKPVESKALLVLVRRLLQQQRLRKRQEVVAAEQPGALDPSSGRARRSARLEEQAGADARVGQPRS